MPSAAVVRRLKERNFALASQAPDGNVSNSLRVQRVQINLRDQVLEVLRNAILDLRFGPGDRLVERELCELVGVSRTSIREALRHLESEGLVINIPNVGPSVAVVDVTEATYIYELRELLEGKAGRLFTERASDDQIEELKNSMKHLSVALTEPDLPNKIRETIHFYELLLAGCGNPLLSDAVTRLHAKIVLLRASSISNPDRGLESLEEMEAIVRAIAQRNPDAAEEACVAHARAARDAALARLGD